MQRAALLLSGAGAAAAGQRRGPRAPSPALAPGGARALHDVSRPAVRFAPCDARGGVRLGSFGGGGGSGGENYQQKLEHRGSETEGEKARGGAGAVTSPNPEAEKQTHYLCFPMKDTREKKDRLFIRTQTVKWTNFTWIFSRMEGQLQNVD